MTQKGINLSSAGISQIKSEPETGRSKTEAPEVSSSENERIIGILTENNIQAARDMLMPETCNGCVHLDRTACLLYGRVVGAIPRPLTRFCFTWELS